MWRIESQHHLCVVVSRREDDLSATQRGNKVASSPDRPIKPLRPGKGLPNSKISEASRNTQHTRIRVGGMQKSGRLESQPDTSPRWDWLAATLTKCPTPPPAPLIHPPGGALCSCRTLHERSIPRLMV